MVSTSEILSSLCVLMWLSQWEDLNIPPSTCAKRLRLEWKQVNSLWPSDAIWRQSSGSTLAQVMACCLMAPSHYLNRHWLIISKSSDIYIRAIAQQMPQPSITKIHLKITYPKFHLNFPGTNALTHRPLGDVAVILGVLFSNLFQGLRS